MIEVFIVVSIVLAVLVTLLILPIVAIVRTRHVGRILDRLDRLEDEIGKLGSQLRQVQPVVQPPPATVEIQEEPLDVLPVKDVPTPIPRPRISLDASWLESWIGQRALGWVAVGLLLFATAFFLKHAFDNQWIGELGRVSLGVIAGTGLCVAGWVAHRRERRLTSQMLTAAGVVLLYLTTFAAFGYYHLLPRERAGVFLLLVVAESATLAVLYNAPTIALMAVVGGLLSPVLLHSDRDQYASLFGYLAVLNVGVVSVACYRRWTFLTPVALIGTQALYWTWYLGNYHPEKMQAALLFQLVVFALFLAHDIVVPALQRRRANVVQLVQLVVNAFLLALAGYWLLDEDHGFWLPTIAVGMAVVYTSLGVLVQGRSAEDNWLQLGAVTVGLGFLATAIGLRGDAGWISLGWAIEGLALWVFGLRIRAIPLRIFGSALLVLAVGRFVLVDTPWVGRSLFVPLFNRYCLPGLAISCCVLAAAWTTRRLSVDRLAWWLLGLGGVLLLWLVLSLEVYQTARTRYPSSLDYREQWRFAQMWLSVFWAVYAGCVIVAGFWQRSRPLRVMALALFGLTLGKVVIVDMADLPGIYRVAAFFVLAVIMGAAAWGYQRLETRAVTSRLVGLRAGGEE